MGLGYATMEEMLVEDGKGEHPEHGRLQGAHHQGHPRAGYRAAGANPGPAPFESKGIGESANIPTAGAIANAVHDAIGVPITDLPITAEKVLAALRGKGA